MLTRTNRAALGRASWHHLHTLLARFPPSPTPSESSALRAYLHLFQRLYPCGECAAHFGEILAKFPPQVGSRNSAVGWGCVVHNEVNKSLGKAEYDCAHVDEEYDCGCGDDGKEDAAAAAHAQAGQEAAPATKPPSDLAHTPGFAAPASLAHKMT